MLVALGDELVRLVDQRMAHRRAALGIRQLLLVGGEHVAQLPDQALDLAGVFQVVGLQSLLGVVVELAHRLDEDLGHVVGRLAQLRAHEQRGQRVALVRHQRLHLGRIGFSQATCLRDSPFKLRAVWLAPMLQP